MSFCLSWNFSN